ncbi:PaiB family negative transcriptional regulator [Williamsia limnetica]|jgi:transcriptional regulator|uniref:PaiB family negative transcriptional regulator n=1 Tax=Williamsia limnetica TaxID=882452 RepID=A0A318RSV5_WILLI|nr:FMN-binding negative transcriptional regulator [Williamsia limnetica]PYE20811.1 PaiB family negative transcriptional regulator [Williamsia limnetica]
MYIPRKFALSEADTDEALTRAGFAHLVTPGVDGLQVTPLPLLYDRANHSLVGHLARANPHWRGVGQGVESVAIFSGPQSYISPNNYATKAETGKVVPTWNYEVLNVYGQVVVHDDLAWLREHVSALTDTHERDLPASWQVSDAPIEFTEGQLKAIVGVQLVIDRVEGKAKMSQNQPVRNRAGVVEGLKSSGRPDQDVVARRVAHFDR